MPDPTAVTRVLAEAGHGAVFISYRSADGKKDASRLAEDLREIFGAAQVFFDKHDLQAGASWREQIDRALDRRPVVLLVLSDQYFGARNAQGLRIEQADDPVRMELLDAIRTQARLLPLLCEGVTMPREADLPAELRPVPQAHALKLRTEDWGADLLKLADRLVALGIAPLDDDWRERFTTPTGEARRWRLRQPLLLGAIAIALAGGGGAAWLHFDAQQRQAEEAAAQHTRALQLLSAGLEAHRGKDVNLDLARVQYLAALEAQPDYGPAHYFLAQIYATQSLREDALGHYRAALAHPAGLDQPQLSDANARLVALERSQTEPTAMGAGATAAAEPPSTSTTPPKPSPVVVATAPRPPPPPPPPVAPTAPAAPAATPTAGMAAASLVARVAAPPARQQDAQTQAAALFADDAVSRLGAATTLGVELAAASDVLPLALQRAIEAAGHRPMSDGERAGVIATLRLVGSASPLSLQAHREAIEQLLQAAGGLDTMVRLQGGAITARQALQASDKQQPLVYIQIAAESQRAYAGQLARRLQLAGYDVPEIENIGAKAPARTDLRAQGFSNLGLARWMAKAIGDDGAAPVGIQVLRRARPAVDTYEIWLGRDLCSAPDQRPAGCARV